MIFALLTLGLGSNQVATGLALTIFGTGMSALQGLTSPKLSTPTPAELSGITPW